jgi:hypothetical protein
MSRSRVVPERAVPTRKVGEGELQAVISTPATGWPSIISELTTYGDAVRLVPAAPYLLDGALSSDRSATCRGER